MADVMSTASDRGQLLLVTALTLAVMLVTVALLLNTAIYTENVATRDTTADGTEAIELRGEAVAGVGDLIETENRQGGGDTGDVDAGVDAMGPLVDRERARHGTIATVELNGTPTAGRLLRWNPPDNTRQFDAAGTRWRLVEGLTDARGFTVSLDPTSLADTTAASSDDTAFGVQFNRSSGDNVTQYIYRDGTGNLSVAQSVEGSTPQRQCTIEHNGTTTVDLTSDRLTTDGSAVDCFRGLWPPEDPESITFVNADAAEGTFGVTVDDSAVPISDPDVQNDPAVYSATVDITYISPELEFNTTVVVTPGEPR